MKFNSIAFTFALLAASLLTSACSTQAWYEGMNRRAENECEKQPPGAREECRASVNKRPYDAYDKERGATK